MNEITPLTYGELEVRTVQIEGDPWFVAMDVCRMLEINNTSHALKR